MLKFRCYMIINFILSDDYRVLSIMLATLAIASSWSATSAAGQLVVAGGHPWSAANWSAES